MHGGNGGLGPKVPESSEDVPMESEPQRASRSGQLVAGTATVPLTSSSSDPGEARSTSASGGGTRYRVLRGNAGIPEVEEGHTQEDDVLGVRLDDFWSMKLQR